jgi:predicted nucleic acid-binding protein
MLNSLFMDTGFIIALVNDNDQYHQKALILADKFEGFPTVITDAVLLEIGNALSKNFKIQATEIINYFYSSPEVTIINLNPILFKKGLELYQSYQDKTWGLVDCISFVVMREMGISDVLTFDKHFAQAGFNILQI